MQVAERIYKSARIFLILLSDGFHLYLLVFPSFLFSIIGIIGFGSIRYRYVEFHAYFVFPFCTLRCLFDGVSALSAAGKLNQVGIKFLERWEKENERSDNVEERMQLQKVRKSWKALSCSSGSLYTFENSILLVSLDNCTQLMFNLLITY